MFSDKQSSSSVPGAPDFTWRELTASQKAFGLGIPNNPGPGQVMRLGHVCLTLAQPARCALGPIVVSSGFRSKRLNRSVGGAADSAHLYGAALDLVPRRVTARRLFAWLAANAKDWDQLIWETDARGRQWVHAAVWPDGDRPNRRQLLSNHPRSKGRYAIIGAAELEQLSNGENR